MSGKKAQQKAITYDEKTVANAKGDYLTVRFYRASH
jgi:hypothetical protein